MVSKAGPKTSASQQDSTSEKPPEFEKALAELEKLVARMEHGEMTLEQALSAHKRGLELAKLCQQRLDAAQQQVRVLEGEVLRHLPAADDEEGGDGSA
jgi:exodeoxyribonuclease VII small subunit